MITVVSGLPRSGTSLMMQMLAAGGLELVADGVRAADDDNPKGYYEIERIKKLKEDASWLIEADGKAIKVISMLLVDLPVDHACKIIFMERNLDEVLASQQKMLERKGVTDKGPPDDLMKQYFNKHLDKTRKMMEQASNMDVFYVSYNKLLVDADTLLSELVTFLGLDLDTVAMKNVIDARLYRQRAR